MNQKTSIRNRVCRRLSPAILLASLLPAASPAEPFLLRDENPLLLGFNLPIALPARIAADGETRVAAVLNWASSATTGIAPGEAILVDAENRSIRFFAERGYAERLSLRVSLPWIYVGGGVLDGFIDGWHEVFGLPDGPRDELPRNQLHIGYMRDGAILYQERESMQGIGDLAVDAGYQWLATERSAVALWVGVELPTGDEEELRGNGAVDLALAVAGTHRLDRHWTVFGQAALSLLGEGEILSAQQEDLVFGATAGIEYAFGQGLNLRAQLDGHTKTFDHSRIDYLGEAVLLTLGGDYRFGSGWQLDLAVTEDIVTDSAPDVSLHFALRRNF